jgi:hypothetical protein
VNIPLSRILLVLSALLACASCSSRAPLNRPLFETPVTADLVRFVLTEIPAETQAEAKIAYISFGDYIVDAASLDFLQNFEGAAVNFVDGKNFRDKEYAGKRFIIDTSTPEELTPLMLQIRAVTRDGTGYHIEAAWAFKEQLSRKLYHVETASGSNVVTVEKEIDLRGFEEAAGGDGIQETEVKTETAL